ncbi:hypothetical protein L7F22_000102 [Adiantum nelumboides]|nr:hypothetical protein [Adiantum nelumboides]
MRRRPSSRARTAATRSPRPSPAGTALRDPAAHREHGPADERDRRAPDGVAELGDDQRDHGDAGDPVRGQPDGGLGVTALQHTRPRQGDEHPGEHEQGRSDRTGDAGPQRGRRLIHRRRQLRGQDRRRRPVARHHLVRHHVGRGALGRDLLGGLAERQRRGLGEQVGHEQVVHVGLALAGQGVVRLGEPDEVGRHEPGALVQQLVERVLAVGARLAPEDLAGGRGDRRAVAAHGLAVGLHRQLLQVGRQPVQVLAVGQHGAGVGAEEVGVPDAEQPGDDRQVLLQRRAPEVLVHGVHTGEELREVLAADRAHQRQPDRRVQRVAAADPVPEPEHVVGGDAELRHLLRVRGHGDEVLRDGPGVVRPEPGQQPGPRVAGVGQRLLRGERLRRDDEQRGRRVEVAGLLGQVGRVDVGDEPALEVALGVVAQRLVGHDRAQVGAADADVDDRADPLPGGPGPRPGPHRVGELAHPVQDGVHVGDDVLAVDGERRVPRQAQRRVQHGPVLGGVHVLTGEHRLGAGGQPGRPRQVREQADGVAGDAVLGVVEHQVGAGGGERTGAVGVVVEQRPQVPRLDLRRVLGQRRPFRGRRDVVAVRVGHDGHHGAAPGPERDGTTRRRVTGPLGRTARRAQGRAGRAVCPDRRAARGPDGR